MSWRMYNSMHVQTYPCIIPFKPDYIILHVGTNDCTNKTSNKVLKELVNLIKNINNKATACDSIPTKSLIENVDKCAPVSNPIINNALQDFLFHTNLN